MSIEKKYYKEIKAIQWNGEESVLSYLKDQYSDQFKCWKTNDGSLRVNITYQQGDYWLVVGDYLIHSKNGWEFCPRHSFESQYNENISLHNDSQ